MKNIKLMSILAGLMLSVNLYAIVAFYNYDNVKPIECTGKFIVNRTDSNATLSIKGKSFELPANIYLDLSTNLMWMACPVGYDLDSTKKVCNAQPTSSFDFTTAQTKAQEINDAVIDYDPSGLYYRDWHVPSVVELHSLYRHPACRKAVIGAVSTTDTRSRETYYNIYTLPSLDNNGTLYWSSSSVAGDGTKAWSVDLESGLVQKSDIGSNLKIILVRKLVLP